MLKRLAPKFIHQIDTWLLENYPVIWMSRVHYALWFGLILCAISAAVGFGVYVELSKRFSFGLWHFLFSLIGFVFFCIWVYNFVIYNKDKNYGTKKPLDPLLNFFLVLFCTGLFAFVPVPFQYTCNWSIANTFTDDEITDDINTLHSIEPYMLTHIGLYKSFRDTVADSTFVDVNILDLTESGINQLGLSKDNFKNYGKLLQPKQIMASYDPKLSEFKLLGKIGQFLEVAAKYGLKTDYTASYYTHKFIEARKSHRYYLDYSNSSIHVRIISNKIENICWCKTHQHYIFDEDFWILLFYVVFILSVLISLFKITFWKQYLLTAIIMIFYPILVLIFSELLPMSSGSNRMHFFYNFIFLFLLFTAYSIYISYKNNRFYQPFYNCMNQVFYIMLAFMPVLLILYLHEYTNLFHSKDYYGWFSDYEMILKDKKPNPEEVYNNYLNRYYYVFWRKEFEAWLQGSLYAGIILFLALLPLINHLFVKQLALPKKK